MKEFLESESFPYRPRAAISGPSPPISANNIQQPDFGTLSLFLCSITKAIEDSLYSQYVFVSVQTQLSSGEISIHSTQLCSQLYSELCPRFEIPK